MFLALSLLMIVPTIQAKDEEMKTVLIKEEKSGEYIYESVVPVEGVTQEEMFTGYPTVITPYASLMAERNSKGKTHVINETNRQLEAIISKLEAAIKNSDGAAKNDDW